MRVISAAGIACGVRCGREDASSSAGRPPKRCLRNHFPGRPDANAGGNRRLGGRSLFLSDLKEEYSAHAIADSWQAATGFTAAVGVRLKATCWCPVRKIPYTVGTGESRVIDVDCLRRGGKRASVRSYGDQPRCTRSSTQAAEIANLV
jgi:hypothetical protein